ncbi:MAG: hypothetical protein LUG98_15370 [Tannerellaceae bacterium]|nr:hypothetical protein [Tannerellaceae bacterium]
MKRINITTLILLIYIAVMAVISWPGNKPEPDYIQYFSIMGLSLVVIIALRFVQIKRMKIRDKYRKGDDSSS